VLLRTISGYGGTQSEALNCLAAKLSRKRINTHSVEPFKRLRVNCRILLTTTSPRRRFLSTQVPKKCIVRYSVLCAGLPQGMWCKGFAKDFAHLAAVCPSENSQVILASELLEENPSSYATEFWAVRTGAAPRAGGPCTRGMFGDQRGHALRNGDMDV